MRLDSNYPCMRGNSWCNQCTLSVHNNLLILDDSDLLYDLLLHEVHAHGEEGHPEDAVGDLYVTDDDHHNTGKETLKI